MEPVTLASLADEATARAADPNGNPAVPPIRFTLGRSKVVWVAVGWSRTQKRRVRIGRNLGDRYIVKSVSPERLAHVLEEANGS